jgi:hypothetical protein
MLTCPSLLGVFGVAVETGAGTRGCVAADSVSGGALPVLFLSACCKFCIFDMWTFRFVDLFINKLVEPFQFECRPALRLLLKRGGAGSLRFRVDVETTQMHWAHRETEQIRNHLLRLFGLSCSLWVETV